MGVQHGDGLGSGVQGLDRAAATTLSQLLGGIAATDPGRLALRHLAGGFWRTTTYGEYDDAVDSCVIALRGLGIESGDRVAIHSSGRPEWLYAALGAQRIGAIYLGLYPTSPSAEVEHVLRDSGARLLVAEDAEQADKALSVIDSLPSLERIIVVDPREVDFSDERVLRWDEVMAGASVGVDTASIPYQPSTPDECTALIYTSGTTGPPKGAMVSHRCQLASSRLFCDAFGMTGNDEIVSSLPLCHVAEQNVSLAMALGSGAIVSFSGGVEHLVPTCSVIRPTVFFGVPRTYEKIAAEIEQRISDAPAPKRLAFRWTYRFVSSAVGAAGVRGRVNSLARRIALRPALRRYGLDRVRMALCGAAPVSPDILRFFTTLGVPVVEGYGMTENTGLGTLDDIANTVPGTVGRPFPHSEVMIGDDGEILSRGPGVFLGYWGRPDATSEAISADGWLHTGDLGAVDEAGRLTITGRKKDILITAGGKNVAPAAIENSVKLSPYIADCILIGDRRPFISALIALDEDIASDWATRVGVAFTTFGDLTTRPEIIALVDEAVQRANSELARAEAIREFRLFDRNLDHDEGEITATGKIKRAVVEARFQSLIDDIYEPSTPRGVVPA